MKLTHWKNGPPEPPFYAVIFISKKSENLDGYAEMDAFLMEEAQKEPGFLGYSSQARPGGGIFISYWQSKESIATWRAHARHQTAKKQAYAQWYDYLHSMICEVESSHLFERGLSEH